MVAAKRLWLPDPQSRGTPRWYQERTAGAKGGARKTLIVALARKLLIGLWSYAADGVLPEGVVLKAA
jgi:transposase